MPRRSFFPSLLCVGLFRPSWGTYDPAHPVHSCGTNTLDGLATVGSAGLQLVYSVSAGVSDDEGTLVAAITAGLCLPLARLRRRLRRGRPC